MRGSKIIPAVFIFILFLLLLSAARYVSSLPFRKTNDALHAGRSAFTLDFLIPRGRYIGPEMTIGEVIRLNFKASLSPIERTVSAVSDIIPDNYKMLLNTVFFFFWSFLFLTFFRLFTFLRYTRALSASLVLGGITYFYMPDLSPGIADDMIALVSPFLLFVIFYALARKRSKTREGSLKKA